MSFGGNSGPSRAEKDAARRQNELLKEQQDTNRRLEVENQQRAKQAEKQRIAMLRGRFGLGGGSFSDSASDASLYSRITGR